MHYLLVVIVLLRKTKEARILPYGNYFTKKGYRDYNFRKRILTPFFLLRRREWLRDYLLGRDKTIVSR